MSSAEVKSAKDYYLIGMMEKIKLYMEKDQLSTVVLIAGCDGQRVSAHRVVLAAASPYFEAMFLGSMRESTDKEVTIGEVHGEVLAMLVHYCYSGDIQLNMKNVESVLVTADLLQLDSIKENCSTFMAIQLDETNCLGILQFADKHNCIDLQKRAQKFIYKNFAKVAEGEEFHQLNADELGKFLASDDLNMSSEQKLFECLMSWVQHDEVNRKQHLPQLLPLIRLPMIDAEFIIDHMDHIYTENGCQQLMYNIYKTKCSKKATLDLRPRNSSERYLLWFTNDKIRYFNPKSEEWKFISDIKIDRYYFAACSLGDEIVIAGGNGDKQNKVEFLNLRDKTCKIGPSMNTGRHSFLMVEVNGLLYAMGGQNSKGQHLTSVECYNPAKGNWKFVQSMPTKLEGSSISVLSGCIYKADTNTIHCYDPKRDLWTIFVTPDKCSGIQYLMEQNKMIYVFCQSNVVFRYEKATQIWKEFSCDADFDMNNFDLVVLNNHFKGAIEVFKSNSVINELSGFYLPHNVIEESGENIIGAKRLPTINEICYSGSTVYRFNCIAVPSSALPLSSLN